jgi:hypothetical protein
VKEDPEILTERISSELFCMFRGRMAEAEEIRQRLKTRRKDDVAKTEDLGEMNGS